MILLAIPCIIFGIAAIFAGNMIGSTWEMRGMGFGWLTMVGVAAIAAGVVILVVKAF